MGGFSGLSGLGSLTSGFQQGAGFVDDLQYRRKRKKALDYTLSQMGREEAAAQANSQDVSDEERAFYGDDTAAAFMPEAGEDPFLYRMMDLFGKRKGRGKKRTAALAGSTGETGAPVQTAPDMTAPESTSNGVSSPYIDPQDDVTGGFADGGEVEGYRDGGAVGDLDSEEVKKRAAENRARTSSRGASTTETAVNDTTKVAEKAAKVGGKLGKLGRLARATAGAGAATAGIAGAVQGLQTPTEDYATRLGMDPNSVGLSFWKDAGIRGAGVMTDVGAAAGDMFGLDLRSNFADVQRQQQGAQPPAAAMAAAPRTAALPPTGSAQVSMARTGGRATAPAAAPARPQPGDPIDMSDIDIDASELPDIKMSDWKRYRAQALRTARLKGLPQGEALEQADRMVTTMQIRGFTGYASQAQALLQTGNTKGALRALRAAYQYFPDGNDVKLGLHKGKLVAVGVDEETGQPFEGGTRVITPEFLAGAIQNFANPQNFLSWTKDWREEAFKNKQYSEVTKPLAAAQGQALLTNADANVARADAMGLRAQALGGVGGLKPSDMRGAQEFFVNRLELMGVTDPEQQDTLASAMAQIKLKYPKIPELTVIDFVMKASQRPDGDQFIQRVLSGQ